MAEETHKGTYQVFNQNNLPSVELLWIPEHFHIHNLTVNLSLGAGQICLFRGGGGWGESESRVLSRGMGY